MCRMHGLSFTATSEKEYKMLYQVKSDIRFYCKSALSKYKPAFHEDLEIKFETAKKATDQ